MQRFGADALPFYRRTSSSWTASQLPTSLQRCRRTPGPLRSRRARARHSRSKCFRKAEGLFQFCRKAPVGERQRGQNRCRLGQVQAQRIQHVGAPEEHAAFQKTGQPCEPWLLGGRFLRTTIGIGSREPDFAPREFDIAIAGVRAARGDAQTAIFPCRRRGALAKLQMAAWFLNRMVRREHSITESRSIDCRMCAAQPDRRSRILLLGLGQNWLLGAATAGQSGAEVKLVSTHKRSGRWGTQALDGSLDQRRFAQHAVPAWRGYGG